MGGFWPVPKQLMSPRIFIFRGGPTSVVVIRHSYGMDIITRIHIISIMPAK